LQEIEGLVLSTPARADQYNMSVVTEKECEDHAEKYFELD